MIQISTGREATGGSPECRHEATPDPLHRAFAGVRAAFPDADGTRAEIAWSVLHGLATLHAGGRLRSDAARARLELAHRMLTGRGAE